MPEARLSRAHHQLKARGSAEEPLRHSARAVRPSVLKGFLSRTPRAIGRNHGGGPTAASLFLVLAMAGSSCTGTGEGSNPPRATSPGPTIAFATSTSPVWRRALQLVTPIPGIQVGHVELRWLLTGPAIPEARRLEVVPEFGGVGAGPDRDDGWVRLAAKGPGAHTDEKSPSREKQFTTHRFDRLPCVLTRQ